MKGPFLIPYKGAMPNVGARTNIAGDAALIGSVTLGADADVTPLVTLRADGDGDGALNPITDPVIGTARFTDGDATLSGVAVPGLSSFTLSLVK